MTGHRLLVHNGVKVGPGVGATGGTGALVINRPHVFGKPGLLQVQAPIGNQGRPKSL